MPKSLIDLLHAIKKRQSLHKDLLDCGTGCLRLFNVGEISNNQLQCSVDLFLLCKQLDFKKSINDPEAALFFYIFNNSTEVFLTENFKELLSSIEKTFCCSIKTWGGAIKEKSKSQPWISDKINRNGLKITSAPKDTHGFVTIEHNIYYKLELTSILNPGLFLDQRENRMQLTDFIKKFGSGPLLNLFSYTGAFSLVAAKEGCETTSVDLSERYSKWQRENHRLNNFDEGHRFLVEDSRIYVDRLKKRILRAKPNMQESMRFKYAIIDPPTFSRAKKGKTFSVKQDLPLLVEGVLSVMKKNSSSAVLVSCNDSAWSLIDFERQMKKIGLAHGYTSLAGRLPTDVAGYLSKKSTQLMRSLWLLRNRASKASISVGSGH